MKEIQQSPTSCTISNLFSVMKVSGYKYVSYCKTKGGGI